MGARTHAYKAIGASGVTYGEAVSIQESLRKCLVGRPPEGEITTVGGVDVAFARRDIAVAAVLVFSWPDLEMVDLTVRREKVDFPYVPGLLSFREVPVIEKAYRRLSAKPNVLFCDGQGFAHPRRFGLACHVGVALGVPTIGCAKSRLIGSAAEPGIKRASSEPLVDRGEVIGLVLRTRDNVKPLYISRGHMMDLDTAVRLVLEAGRGYRLPEPTRQAHALVTKAKKALATS